MMGMFRKTNRLVSSPACLGLFNPHRLLNKTNSRNNTEQNVSKFTLNLLIFRLYQKRCQSQEIILILGR